MITISPKLINILILQVGWWGITLSYPTAQLYIPLTFTLLCIHFVSNKLKLDELIFILVGCLIGCSVDFLAMSLKLWLPIDSFSIFPPWLICYWLIFLTSFSQSLNWLREKVLLTGLLGFIFGPLSYFAGEKFSILKFQVIENFSPLISMIIYGLLWAINYIILFKAYIIIKRPNSRII